MFLDHLPQLQVFLENALVFEFKGWSPDNLGVALREFDEFVEHLVQIFLLLDKLIPPFAVILILYEMSVNDDQLQFSQKVLYAEDQILFFPEKVETIEIRLW